MLKTLLILLFLFFFSSPVYCGIYKWVDADGVTHYSEESPKNVPTREVEIEPPPSLDSVDEARARLEQLRQQNEARQRRDAERKQQAAANTERVVQAERRKAADCVTASKQLRVLEQQLPVYRDEEGVYHTQSSRHSASYEGKRDYLEDPERLQEIARLREQVETRCESSEAGKRRLLADQLADYHRQQCLEAKKMVEALEKDRFSDYQSERRGLEKDIDRHCHYRRK